MLERKFCKMQVRCEDTGDFWICTAKLETGRAPPCPFTHETIKLIGTELVLSQKGLFLGQCQDWEFPTEMWHTWIEV